MLDVAHGHGRLGRHQRTLIQQEVEATGISGSLYFGYPVLTTADGRQPCDALLVSKQCGIVGLLLPSDAVYDKEGWRRLIAEQDGLFAALETQLGRHQALRARRKIAVPVSTFTILPSGNWSAPSDCEATFVRLSELGPALLELDGIDDPSLCRRVRSVVEHVISIKPAKRRDNVKKEDSRGAKLKRIEQEIANLDRWQKQAAIATPDGPQRIRGLAGSGKTVVLALKAAYLHAQHPEWRIAVVFYSQALYQQFEDLVRRFCFEHLQEEPDWSRIHILHAWGSSYRKGFYYELADSVKFTARNWTSALAQFGRDDAFGGCCSELLMALPPQLPEETLFDVVLIDEAQDMPVSFFRLVHRATSVPKRIVWAYDELQQLSAVSVPNARDLFGVDDRGNPLVSLEDVPGEAQHDVVLPVCYRNPPWTLTVAHGLGFGTARRGGLAQHFDDPTLWEDVGYEPVTGHLQLGAQVSLRRKTDSYPEFFEREMTADDAVSVHAFASDVEQISWVVSSIKAQLEADELELDDFLVVLPDEYTAKSRAAKFISAFAQRGIRAHNAGVHTERDVVFQEDSIAVAHIYRAKGNEAPFVYVVDAEYATSPVGSAAVGIASRRNKLFTAITRSRAWVRISGVGPAMNEIEEEVRRIRIDGYRLSFKVPTRPELDLLRQLHRDRTEAERVKITKQKTLLAELAESLSRDEISAAEFDGLSPTQKSALRKLLDRVDE